LAVDESSVRDNPKIDTIEAFTQAQQRQFENWEI
jgi:hypothetical protein